MAHELVLLLPNLFSYHEVCQHWLLIHYSPFNRGFCLLEMFIYSFSTTKLQSPLETDTISLFWCKSVCSQQFIKLQEKWSGDKVRHESGIKGGFLADRNMRNQKQGSTLLLINCMDMRSRTVLCGWKARSSNGSIPNDGLQPTALTADSVFSVIITALQRTAGSKGPCYTGSVGPHSLSEPSAPVGIKVGQSHSAQAPR